MFELHTYPLDCQDAHISFYMRNRQYEINYMLNPVRKSTLIKSGVNLMDWDALPTLCGCFPVSEDDADGLSDIKQFTIFLQLQRKSAAVIFNVFLPVQLITMLTWIVYAVETSDIGDRLTIGLTMLLVTVAFKFVVAGKLPDLPYTTFCDHYMLFCLTTQVIPA